MICKGSYIDQQGTACGNCERCEAEKYALIASGTWHKLGHLKKFVDVNYEDLMWIIGHSSLEEWTWQGFGMLRMYPKNDIKGDVRLNFWHKAFRTVHNSMTHNHPWNLTSRIMRGEIVNTRYVEEARRMPGVTVVYDRHFILTGEGGGIIEPRPKKVYLRHAVVERFLVGQTYTQKADEIHLSSPSDGTLTLNHRVRVGTQEHAFSFCPAGEVWQSAEPKPATQAQFEFMLKSF